MGIGAILVGIFVGVPLAVCGFFALDAFLVNVRNKRDEEQEAIKSQQHLYNEILQSNYIDTEANITGSVKELPKLTFQRWLTFYNTNPNNWDVDVCRTQIGTNNGWNRYVPTYYKTTYHYDNRGKKRTVVNVTAIPVFWTDAAEMMKFDEWLKTSYKAGDAAIYRNKQDEYMEQLTEFLQEDINERRRKIQEEYAKVVDSVKIGDIELKIQENGKKVFTSTGDVFDAEDYK